MASSQTLEAIDKYPFHKKSHEEIVTFLKKLFLTINNILVEYLDVANIQDGSTTLSMVVVYKNSLYTAHIGDSRIYLIPRDETPTLLSQDPSYKKRISKNTLSNIESSHYLGDKSLTEENIFVTHEENLYHKDTLFLTSSSILDSLTENKFNKDMAEIEELLIKNPPSQSTSFLRYLHYERSVEVLRVGTQDIENSTDETEIDWEKIIPIAKKITLVTGILIIILFITLLLTQDSEPIEENDLNQSIIKKDAPITNHPITSLSQTPAPMVKEEDSSVSPINEVAILPTAIEPILETKNTIKEKIPNTVIIKEQIISPQTVKLLHKADSDILYTDDIRITFKEDQLIASKENLFYEKNDKMHTLYAHLNANDSEVQGEIVDKLQKQRYSNSIIISIIEKEVYLKIEIKSSCQYIHSQWAKKSGLDLLTFNCQR
jgi:hypothetical protein